uniref:Chromo domain-containing protein n=1 Tax=Ananas comosus var. bracteatus TaxID=296719 RepID=A0A6V7PWE9_ANACO|nr:unnamed protein product [Ananas comosus var. bracteatus]
MMMNRSLGRKKKTSLSGLLVAWAWAFIKWRNGSLIHPVFHISQLKRSPTTNSKVTNGVPVVGKEGQLLAEPEGVLAERAVKRGRGIAKEVLVKWSNLPPESATCEDPRTLRLQFLEFDPEDRDRPKGRGL